ncbi:reverse transcriptase domain-containing protein [Intestinimonas butyriciproducens]|uniref:reverse transcriptase domain-containing protein n=1 Tax=Intestinimonas butyriciproducens TaxID=1297617 RepID=UPI00051C0254|nr:reverse transcriptase domain-containing protein [Intestinimonas butyriciproducens]
MNAARHFRRYFSPKRLENIYSDKIKYRATVGMDRIAPKAFEDKLDENVQLISQKVLSGKYKFTRYREVLISKGRRKEPRVISIPTIRDKLALSAYHQFLQSSFGETVQEPLLHTIVGDITQEVLSGHFDGYVKIDITHFYASIDHHLLLRKVKKKIRKSEAIHFLEEAITTETITRVGSAPGRGKNKCGVPEGLSISNILADIYLSDFKEKVCSRYDVCFYRYVDDILILCNASDASKIKDLCVKILKSDFALDANEKKTMSGEIANGVPFLGYMFFDNKVGIRPSAEEKLEASIEELFRLRKRQTISQQVFAWRLNLRITGCILDSKKYGWLFYYSQLTDLKILFHLDWLVDHLFCRYGFEKTKDIKRFVRTYHEITKNVSGSNYILNADRYSIEEKAEILSGIYGQEGFDKKDSQTVDNLFKAAMFKEVQRLEYDIQNFS